MLIQNCFCRKKAFSKNAPQKFKILNFITWEFEVQNFMFFFILLQNVPSKNMGPLLGSDQLWVARRDFLVLQIFSDYVFCFRQLLPHGSSAVSHWSVEALSSEVSQIVLAVAAWPLRWCGELFSSFWLCSYKINYLLSSFCGLYWKWIGSMILKYSPLYQLVMWVLGIKLLLTSLWIRK